MLIRRPVPQPQRVPPSWLDPEAYLYWERKRQRERFRKIHDPRLDERADIQCAIAPDGSVGQNGGTAFDQTLTWPHTVNGPNPLLVVWGRVDNTATKTLTCTYFGTPMISITNAIYAYGASSRYFLFYITGITGTHDIILTADDNTGIVVGMSMAYTGAKQISGQPNAAGQQANTTITCTLNTLEANEWIVVGDINNSSGVPSTATGGSTRRITSSNAAFFDQGPYATPGSNSISMVADPGGPDNYQVFASFAPAVIAGNDAKIVIRGE